MRLGRVAIPKVQVAHRDRGGWPANVTDQRLDAKIVEFAAHKDDASKGWSTIHQFKNPKPHLLREGVHWSRHRMTKEASVSATR
jgi:hypothetical protein